jgi:prepilin peptidase CpaA
MPLPKNTFNRPHQELVMMLLHKEFVYPAAASVIALIAAGFDVKSRRIPNFITGPAILAGLLLHASYEGWHGLFSSLAAGLICGVIFLIFYLAGGMGAGDVKLITAVGCLAGLSNSASVLVITALAGGVMAICFALSRGQLKSTLFNVAKLATHHKDQGLTPHPEINVRNASTLRLPYGLAIAAGSCITLYLQGMQR